MTLSALPPTLAIVSKSSVPFSDLAEVAQVLQVQAGQHFAPEWAHRYSPSILPYPSEKSVPHGAWKLILKDQLDDPNALGYHTDAHNQPYALIEAQQNRDDWSVTLSHELLEMLGDPWGSRLCRAPSPDPSAPKGKRVNLLVELCDPCEGNQFAYRIGNVLVSDFVGHGFYRTHPRTGVLYSYTGAVTKPGQVLPDGYVSWEDNGQWYQLTDFGGVQVNPLGRFPGGSSLREWTDFCARQAKEQS